MKIFKIIIIGIAFLFASQTVDAQTIKDLGWTRVSGFGQADVNVVTKRSDTLFAFTASEIYASMDNGDTWVVHKNIGYQKKEFLATRGSIAIFRSDTYKSSGGLCSDTTFEFTKVSFYDGSEFLYEYKEYYKRYICVYELYEARNKIIGAPFILNEERILFNVDVGTTYSPGHVFYDNFVKKTPYINSNWIIGQWGEQWVYSNSYGLGYFTIVGASVGKQDTIYGASANGIMHYTYDSGETWLEHTIPQGATDYFMKDGFHVLTTEDGVYTSTDGLNFNLFSTSPSKFWVFGNFILSQEKNNWSRSFDKGNNWESFSPQGIGADKIDNLLTYEDTVYVVIDNVVYQHDCQSKFVLASAEKQFFSALKDNYIITPNNIIFNGSQKYDGTEWSYNNIGTVKKYYRDGNRVFAILPYSENIYFTDDDGLSWKSIVCPSASGISNLSAKGDTLVISGHWSWIELLEGEYANFYSTDFGSSWVPMFRSYHTPNYFYFDDSISFALGYYGVFTVEDFVKTGYIGYGYYPNMSEKYWDLDDYFMGQRSSYDIEYQPLIDKKNGQLYKLSNLPTKQWFSFKESWKLAPELINGVADFVAENPSDKMIFIGSKVNGLWRSVAHPLSEAVQPVTLNYAACKDEPFKIDGVVYPLDINNIKPKQSPCDADTIIHVHLGVIDTTVYLDYCNSSVKFRGHYYLDGVYEEVWPSSLGCDTSATIVVTKNVVEELTEIYGWPGDSILYEGKIHYFPSLESKWLYSQEGCDSVNVKTHFISKLTKLKEPIIFVCASDSLEFANQLVTYSGIYYDTIHTTTGFDSVAIEQPIYFYPYNLVSVNKSRFLCEGDSITVNDMVISELGFYTTVYMNEKGCDSLKMILKVFGVKTFNKEVAVQAGEIVGGVKVETDTVFTQVIPAVSGCDSIINIFQVSVVVGVGDVSLNHIELYPNPTKDDVTIHNIKRFDFLEIKNVLGESMERVDINKNTINLNLEHYPAGLYFVILYENTTRQTILKFEIE